MITLESRVLEEKLSNIKKCMEILGGNVWLKENLTTNEELVMAIIDSALKGEHLKFGVNENVYPLATIEKEKLNFEKHVLKNKNKVIQYITQSIKKNNSDLNSLIKKFYKDGTGKQFDEIEAKILKTYGEDIHKLFLIHCNVDHKSNEECNEYYGEYLLAKREDLIKAIITKF